MYSDPMLFPFLCLSASQLVDGDQVPAQVRAEKPKDKFIIRFFPKAD